MGLLKNLVKGMSEDKQILKSKLKDAEQDRKIQRILEEREKSHNRRLLEQFMREQEEEKIEKVVREIKKKKSGEMWKGEKSILKSDNNILNGKNIFSNKQKILQLNNNMFLK